MDSHGLPLSNSGKNGLPIRFRARDFILHPFQLEGIFADDHDEGIAIIQVILNDLWPARAVIDAVVNPNIEALTQKSFLELVNVVLVHMAVTNEDVSHLCRRVNRVL